MSVPTRATSPLQRAADQLLLGGGAAVVSAMLQLMVVRLFPIQFSVFEWEYRSSSLLWKTPWGYLLAYAPVALALALGAAVLPRLVTLRTALTVWATLGFWSVGLMYPELHGLATLVLAVGLALPVARWLSTRWEARRPRLRMASVALILLALAARPLHNGWRSWREGAVIGALPAAPQGAPNLIILIWDTVRASSLSLYGAPLPTTPVLDSLARHAVTFDDAFATAPWTLPSHGSIFTGRYASATKTEFARELDAEAPTLADALQQRGWATGGFTANVGATREASGLARGFVRYEDLADSFDEILRSTPLVQADFFLVLLENLRTRRLHRIVPELRKFDFGNNFTAVSHDHKKAPTVTGDFLEWQASLPAGRPFFAFLNFWDAHSPYVSPPEYARLVGAPGERAIDRYHAAIRFIDHEMGEMLAELKRRGVLDNTVVIITSDHGEQFGEHGLTLHSNSLYRQLLHVPFVVLYPRAVPAGTHVPQPVSLRDLPATALDLLGVPPQTTGIGGASLASTWAQGDDRGSDVFSEVSQHYRGRGRFRNGNGPMESIVTDSLHVIRDGDGGIEAYATAHDPAQEHDLAKAHRMDSLAALLDSALARHAPVRTGSYVRSTAPPPPDARRRAPRASRTDP